MATLTNEQKERLRQLYEQKQKCDAAMENFWAMHTPEFKEAIIMLTEKSKDRKK